MCEEEEERAVDGRNKRAFGVVVFSTNASRSFAVAFPFDEIGGGF
jgi:hypothetical protein